MRCPLHSSHQAENLAKTIDLITFIRLQEMLSRGHPDAVALDLNETEESTIHSITEALKHEKTGGKVDIVRGLFTGEGEHLGVPCKYRASDLDSKFTLYQLRVSVIFRSGSCALRQSNLRLRRNHSRTQWMKVTLLPSAASRLQSARPKAFAS